jgi:hypothetical protein
MVFGGEDATVDIDGVEECKLNHNTIAKLINIKASSLIFLTFKLTCG